MKLRDYQKTGVEFLLKRKTALLADDMGLGKTATAIVAAEKNNVFPWVIVCPSTIKDQWAASILEWTTDFAFVQVIRTGKDKIKPAHVYIVSYALAKVLLDLPSIGVLIVDEAHYCKSIETQRTLMTLGKKYLGGMAKKIWALTGTPIFNRPIDLYSLLLTMYPNALVKAPTFEDFARRYNSGYWPRSVSYRTPENMRMGRAKNTEEIKLLIESFMLRRLKFEVLDEWPAVCVNVIDAEVCSAKRLKTLNDKYEKSKTINEKQEFMRDPRGERVKLRQEYAYLKLDFTIEYLKVELTKYKKIAVFVYHRGIAEELRLGLRKFKPVVYQGGMNDREKTEALQAFQEQDSQVFIGQIRAAGTGLDGLQKVCYRGIFVEWDHAPGAVDQTIDRLNRLGQGRGVLISFVVVPDSLESDSIKSLVEKDQDNKSIIK